MNHQKPLTSNLKTSKLRQRKPCFTQLPRCCLLGRLNSNFFRALANSTALMNRVESESMASQMAKVMPKKHHNYLLNQLFKTTCFPPSFLIFIKFTSKKTGVGCHWSPQSPPNTQEDWPQKPSGRCRTSARPRPWTGPRSPRSSGPTHRWKLDLMGSLGKICGIHRSQKKTWISHDQSS